MFEALPIDNPAQIEDSCNVLQENLALAMDKRGIEAKDIINNTNIPWGTLMGWIYGDVKSQHAGEHLLNLITYLNCTSDWLCFGIGEDDMDIGKFPKRKPDLKIAN